MREERIYSKNAKYQKFEVLKTNRNKRYKYGEFFVEGVRNINTAIQNGWKFSSLIYSDEMQLSNWAKDIIRTLKTEVNYVLPAHLMQELSGKEIKKPKWRPQFAFIFGLSMRDLSSLTRD